MGEVCRSVDMLAPEGYGEIIGGGTLSVAFGLDGRTVTGIEPVGKHLWISLDDGQALAGVTWAAFGPVGERADRVEAGVLGRRAGVCCGHQRGKSVVGAGHRQAGQRTALGVTGITRRAGAGQAQVHLVYQGRGLQRLAGPLAPHVRRGEAPEFLVHGRGGLVC